VLRENGRWTMIIKHDFGPPRGGNLTPRIGLNDGYLPETATRLLLGFDPVCHSLFSHGFFDTSLILSMTRFLALQPAQFTRLSPALVMSPLVVSGGSDAIEIAARLAGLGYSGRYLAFVSVVPSKTLIVDEIRNIAPNIDFEVIELSKTDLDQPVFKG